MTMRSTSPNGIGNKSRAAEDALRAIDAAPRPLTQSVWKALVSQVTTAAGAEAQRVFLAARDAVASCEERVANALRRAGEQRALVAKWEDQFAAIGEFHVVRAAVSGIAFVMFTASEWALTNETLPALLDVPSRSIGGIALSVAPVAAPIVLDLALGRLVGLDSVWVDKAQKGNESDHTRDAVWRRRAQGLAHVLLLASAAGLAMWVPLLMADLRTIPSVVLRDAASAASALNHAQPRIDFAVLLTGGTLALFGCLAWSHCVAHSRRAWQRVSLGWRLRKARPLREEHDAEVVAAQAQLDVAKSRLFDADAEARRARDVFEAEATTRLNHAWQEPGTPEERLRHILRAHQTRH